MTPRIPVLLFFPFLAALCLAFDHESCWMKRTDPESCYNGQIQNLKNPLSTDVRLVDMPNVIVITVASNTTDGYLRLIRSADLFNIPVRTLGLGQPWHGGDMKTTGGGQKVNLLRKELIPYKDDTETIVLFTDAYDVIYVDSLDVIVERFLQSGARILFGAEGFCWPDESLAAKYPAVSRGKQYLNSGAFIGYAADLFSVLTYHEVGDQEDDQLFYTKVYLDEEMRKERKIQLDHKSTIFLNLYGAMEELEIKWENNEPKIFNSVYNTQPAVLHGNGPAKKDLNGLSNYVPRAWIAGEGCRSCKEGMIELDLEKKSSWPKVLMSVFIARPMPFLAEFFATLKRLDYPQSRIDLFIYNNVEGHEKAVEEFLTDFDFRSVKRIRASDNISDVVARGHALEHFNTKKSDYYFNIDAEARLDNPHSLKLLIEQNRRVVAPMLVRPYKAWSNFWGALTEAGYYARSPDYMDIVNNVKRGLWNVPYISACYLINGTVLRHPDTVPSYLNGALDPDMAFSANMRYKGIFMYVSNRVDFGHLVDSEDFSLDNVNPDFYTLLNNQWDWEQKYLHENYSKNLSPDVAPLQPCPDVFWFPVASTKFCDELVAIMEGFGKWSQGKNEDDRLNGGYEAVPTRDIHMNQVGLEQQWLLFLKLYVLPLNQKVFAGYQDTDPRSLMNFVVRYRPDEQPSLRPHHDSSTYTINIALNTPNVDYEGGGCRFLRYNCSVTETKKGWLLMHPGRLTHFHEGLRVTNGTRYIMISFIDP